MNVESMLPKTPMVRRKRAHDVADEIGKLIDSGEFPVGDRLPTEKELMQRFGVGRPAVREALFFLEQQGMIEIVNGARARVIPPSPVHLIRQFTQLSKRLSSGPDGQQRGEQARLVLEAGQSWLAATVASDDDIKRLRAALDANVAAVGDRIEFIRTDVAFHYEIAAITGNPVFTMVYEAVVDWLVDQRTTTYHMPDADTLSVRDHTAIYDAIAAHEHDLLAHATERLGAVPGLRIVGTARQKAAVVSFVLDFAHPHDVGTILDQEGIALRTGHHCAQPVMDRYGLPATARASFSIYNGRDDVDALVAGIEKVRELFA